MTSQIIASSIDPEYPIAGQDNDSQGFRDNFSAIQTALLKAAEEITDLHSNVVLKANLSDNSPVTNDLGKSLIINGSYRDFHGKSVAATASTQTDIDIRSGNLQQFTLDTSNGGTVDFTLRHWPTSGNYAVIRLHFVSNSTSGSCSARIYSENGGTFVAEDGVTMVGGHPVITVQGTADPATDNKHQVVEVWTYTGSTTRKMFVRYLGEF